MTILKIPGTIYDRTIQKKIIPFFEEETVIVIHGARQTGKTYLLFSLLDYLQKQKKRVFYYDLEDPLLLSGLNRGYSALIDLIRSQGYHEEETVYIFIDEIQYLDNPSSFLKLLSDHYKNIHLVVSGSSTFAIKSKFRDSLAGRTVDFELFPLSFKEFLEFREQEYELEEAKSPYIVEKLKSLYEEYILYGSYPKIVRTADKEKKRIFLSQIIDTYIRKDIRDLGKIEDIRKFNSLLFVLASQTGQLLNVSRLSKETSLSVPTVEKYLSLLEETYIIKLLTPFSKNPHVEIVKNPKIFFYDSGLASLLWLKDFPKTILGNLLETAVFAEYVKKYGRESLHFWRTKNKQEVDFIFNMMPIEVKLHFDRFEKSAVSSFQEKYSVTDFRVISLLGEKKGKEYIYPWEI